MSNYHIDLAKEDSEQTAVVTWRWTLSSHTYPTTGTDQQWPYGRGDEEPVVEVLDTGSNSELDYALDEALTTIQIREFIAQHHPILPPETERAVSRVHSAAHQVSRAAKRFVQTLQEEEPKKDT